MGQSYKSKGACSFRNRRFAFKLINLIYYSTTMVDLNFLSPSTLRMYKPLSNPLRFNSWVAFSLSVLTKMTLPNKSKTVTFVKVPDGRLMFTRPFDGLG